MIELVNIIYLIFSILLLCHFPFTNSFYFRLNYVSKFSNIENLCINLSFILNLFLITSFFEINLNKIFIVLIALSLINITLSYKNLFLRENFFLILITYIISVYLGSNLKLEWDGQLWIYKTINFYDGNSFFNLINIPGIVTYPHLGTFSWAFFWKNSFVDHEYTGRIFYVFCYILAIVLIISQNKKKILSSCLILFLFILLSYEKYLLGGYQEYLTFSILIFIYYFLDKYFLEKKIHTLIAAFLFMNAAIWIKNEAAVFIIFIFFVFFYKGFIKNKINKKIILVFLSYIILNVIKNYIFFESFGEINKGWPDYKTTSFGEIFNFIYIIDRAPYIIMHICIALIKNEVYLLFLIVLVYQILKKKNIGIFMPYLIFLFFNIMLVFTIYFLSNNPDWRTYISTTADRLFFQTSGIYLLLIYQVVYDIYKKNI